MDEWKKANEWEHEWHLGQQFNSYNEETKQYTYASKMGLDPYRTDYYGIKGWDFGDKTIVDMGGSGQSLLLKSKAKKRVVVDPILPSEWMILRYKEAGIEFSQTKGEDFIADEIFDIGLLYNVLQHTQNPQQIVRNLRKYCKVIHVFEWIETGISDGHIHNLTEKGLNEWLGGYGKVENVTGTSALFGIFKGDHFNDPQYIQILDQTEQIEKILK